MSDEQPRPRSTDERDELLSRVESSGDLQRLSDGPAHYEGSRDSQEQAAEPESGAQRSWQPMWGQGQLISGSPQGQPARNVMVEVERAVAAASFRHGQGEQVDYAVSLTATANEHGQVQPVILVVLGLPGITLGEKAHVSALWNNLWISAQEIDDSVRELMEMVRRHRSEQAQQIVHRHR